jgi:hypothetical protein
LTQMKCTTDSPLCKHNRSCSPRNSRKQLPTPDGNESGISVRHDFK